MRSLPVRFAWTLLAAALLAGCGRELVKVRLVRPGNATPREADTNVPPPPPEADAPFAGIGTAAPSTNPVPATSRDAVTHPQERVTPWLIQRGTDRDRASARVAHPLPGLTNLLRPGELAAWLAQPEEVVRSVLELEPARVRDRVVTEMPLDGALHHPLVPVALVLARRGAEGTNPAASARAVDLLVEMARHYNPDTAPASGLYTWLECVPVAALLAYDLVYDDPRWNDHSPVARDAVERWFRDRAQRLRDLAEAPGEFSNVAPDGFRHLGMFARVLNERTAALAWCAGIDRLLGPENFFADHVWNEGAATYGLLVLDSATVSLDALSTAIAAMEPASRLAPLDAPSVARWRESCQRARDAARTMRFPDGRLLPHGDTDFAASGGVVTGLVNTVWNDYGLAAVSAGRGAGGINAYLSATALARGGRYGGSHQHDDRLSLALWSQGADLLPDTGYPMFRRGNYRFLHCSPWMHNMTVASSAEGKSEPGWARSRIVAYDPGASPSAPVRAVVASSPGPLAEGISVNERAVLVIGADAERAYAVDVTWVQGGVVHESFLRSGEDEAFDVRASLPWQTVKGTLAELLGTTAGCQPQHRERFRVSGMLAAPGNFDVTLTGRTSGTALRAHLRAIPNETVYLSQYPRFRPTQHSPERRDEFPGWHVYRRREVAADELTAVAAVYETQGRGQRPVIVKVEWIQPEPADASAVGLRVFLRDRIDTWYLSRDTTRRRVGSWSAAGRIAGASSDGASMAWSYIWGPGELRGADGSKREGVPAVAGDVLAIGDDAAQGRSWVEAGAPFPADASLAGAWARIEAPDGSGTVHRITAIRRIDEERVRVEVEGRVGWRRTSGGLARTHFPLTVDAAGTTEIAGTPRLVVERPSAQTGR